MTRVRRPVGFAIGLMAVLLILGPSSSLLMAGPAAGASADGTCLGQVDTDEDGFVDCVDNCPVLVNDQTDSDDDGIGDACDCDVDIDTTDDGDDGECSVDCTLREAIDVAPGGCAIRVPAGTYSIALDSVDIVRSVTLLGDGADATVLDAPGGGLAILGEEPPVADVFLQGLTLARGGIGVLSNNSIATLYLSNSVIRDNSGSGIILGNVNCCFAAFAELHHSTIRDNLRQGVKVSGNEAGIGRVTIDHCARTGNGATNVGGGGLRGGWQREFPWVGLRDRQRR